MINLLPPAVKEDYRYGLRNSTLMRWLSVFLLGIVGLGLIATYGLLTMQDSIRGYDNQVQAAQAELKKQDLAGTEAHVKAITGEFKLVVQVLSKEVLFSKLLRQIATVIPSRSILTGLTINQAGGAIDISAAASDYTTATQVQVNLQDPANKIFSKADIISITCQNASATIKYPCTIQLRALFGDSSPYLFINNKDSSR